ncbi:sodium-dependent phosphate transport protein 2B-like [Oratosquilla oratoria]|uniref:sodium-dependent phosphate transport protein 2B-like n=1 Tax=Oratosquilla oratoria TaxID=337810 RepID=UPI003F75B3BD
MVANNSDPPPYGASIVGKGEVNLSFTPDKELESKATSTSPDADDPWELPELVDNSIPWSDLTTGEKIKRVVINAGKFVSVLTLLYFFVCSLDFLASSFRLISGKTTGAVFQNEFLTNPVVGLMIGILVTVLVQSSSTSTSIIVSLVAADMLHVHEAVPMIMGANIGTSVTNTIVSLTQVGDRNEFRRAFAGATVHDMFNWLSVFTLLSLELATGLLETVTNIIVNSYDWSGQGANIKLLKVVTEPFTKNIIRLDKKVLKGWSQNDPKYENASLIKRFCDYEKVQMWVNETVAEDGTTVAGHFADKAQGIAGSCSFLFADTPLTDTQVGLILLVIALVMLCGALVIIVKILHSMLRGSIAIIIKKTLNANIPYVPWITGYIAILIGAIVTFLVQSSSIFTSALTPLIGIGVITVERSYPLTLGSNIGTTTTALIASMAGEGTSLKYSIQIALVHLLFNIFGILIFYPIPFMRFPIPMAKVLGNTTAKYRWFAVFYLVLMFFLLPGFVFILSLGGPLVFPAVGVPLLLLFLIVILINIMQRKKPELLPFKLRTWTWLPKPLRSLEPYDRIFTALPCCRTCKESQQATEELKQVTVSADGNVIGVDNPACDINSTKI